MSILFHLFLGYTYAKPGGHYQELALLEKDDEDESGNNSDDEPIDIG